MNSREYRKTEKQERQEFIELMRGIRLQVESALVLKQLGRIDSTLAQMDVYQHWTDLELIELARLDWSWASYVEAIADNSHHEYSRMSGLLMLDRVNHIFSGYRRFYEFYLNDQSQEELRVSIPEELSNHISVKEIERAILIQLEIDKAFEILRHPRLDNKTPGPKILPAE